MKNMKKILVTGSNGQLGSEIREICSNHNQHNFIFTDIEELNITKMEDVKIFFENNDIDFIINCAAYTAVDKAENDIKNARLVNVLAVSNLAEKSANLNIPIIHISTDYVFSGDSNQPINESTPENPQSIYGKSKYDGEEILIATTYNYIIIRTSWLYSTYGNNFLKTMLRLGNEKQNLNVVFDQIGTPTYAADLANAIIKITNQYFENNEIEYGLYHYSNEGIASWYDFAYEIFEQKEINCKLTPILSSNYPTPAKRPFYSVFDKTKIKKTFDLEIPHWKQSLKICLEKMK